MTDVKGSWTVPTVTVSGRGAAYSSTWVGIDGDNSSTVEQIGTDSDQANGKAVYYAWYEMYPAYPVYLDGKGNDPYLPVNKGDKISAEVSYNGSAFVLSITDVTSAKSYTTIQTLASAQQSSAEWVVEAPSSGRSVLPLADFGSETFTNAQATISGTTANIGAFLQGNSSTAVYKLDIANQNRRSNQYTYLATTGELNSTGDSFTVNYGATQPPPPAKGPVKFGPMDRLIDLPLTVAATPAAAGSSLGFVEIPPVTPGAVSAAYPVLANVQPGFLARDAFFNQPGGTARRFFVVGAGMADAEGDPEADLSWFGLPPVPAPAVPLAVPVVQGSSTFGGSRFASSAEPNVTVWSRMEQPAVPPPSTLGFAEDAHMDQMMGALVLVAFLPSLQIPKVKEEPERARRLSDGNRQPE